MTAARQGDEGTFHSVFWGRVFSTTGLRYEDLLNVRTNAHGVMASEDVASIVADRVVTLPAALRQAAAATSSTSASAGLGSAAGTASGTTSPVPDVPDIGGQARLLVQRPVGLQGTAAASGLKGMDDSDDEDDANEAASWTDTRTVQAIQRRIAEYLDAVRELRLDTKRRSEMEIKVKSFVEDKRHEALRAREAASRVTVSDLQGLLGHLDLSATGIVTLQPPAGVLEASTTSTRGAPPPKERPPVDVGMTSPVSSSLAAFRGLKTLILSRNELTAVDVAAMPSSLQTLVVNNCRLTQFFSPLLPTAAHFADSLVCLAVACNQLTSLDFIAAFPSLCVLDASFNCLTNLPHAAACVATRSSLSELTLAGNPIALLGGYRRAFLKGRGSMVLDGAAAHDVELNAWAKLPASHFEAPVKCKLHLAEVRGLASIVPPAMTTTVGSTGNVGAGDGGPDAGSGGKAGAAKGGKVPTAPNAAAAKGSKGGAPQPTDATTTPATSGKKMTVAILGSVAGLTADVDDVELLCATTLAAADAVLPAAAKPGATGKGAPQAAAKVGEAPVPQGTGGGAPPPAAVIFGGPASIFGPGGAALPMKFSVEGDCTAVAQRGEGVREWLLAPQVLRLTRRITASASSQSGSPSPPPQPTTTSSAMSSAPPSTVPATGAAQCDSVGWFILDLGTLVKGGAPTPPETMDASSSGPSTSVSFAVPLTLNEGHLAILRDDIRAWKGQLALMVQHDRELEKQAVADAMSKIATAAQLGQSEDTTAKAANSASASLGGKAPRPPVPTTAAASGKPSGKGAVAPNDAEAGALATRKEESALRKLEIDEQTSKIERTEKYLQRLTAEPPILTGVVTLGYPAWEVVEAPPPAAIAVADPKADAKKKK